MRCGRLPSRSDVNKLESNSRKNSRFKKKSRPTNNKHADKQRKQTKERILQRPAMRSQSQIQSAWPSMSHHRNPRKQKLSRTTYLSAQEGKGELGLPCRANIYPKDLTSAQSDTQLQGKIGNPLEAKLAMKLTATA